MDLTLAAFYGPKPGPFSDLIDFLQAALKSRLGTAFLPYALEQVHATIVGLEGWRNGLDVFNTNANLDTRDLVVMDLEGLFLSLRRVPPLHIRLGGFVAGQAYPFTSRGLHPYYRSFTLNGPLAVAMGWPVAGKSYPLALDVLRREFRQYNIVHKYHRRPDDIDNDFFFVLGLINRSVLTEGKFEEVQDELRLLMSGREPLALVVRPDDLSVVAYMDTQLSPSTSVRYSIDQALVKLDDLKLLYPKTRASYQAQTE